MHLQDFTTIKIRFDFTCEQQKNLSTPQKNITPHHTNNTTPTDNMVCCAAIRQFRELFFVRIFIRPCLLLTTVLIGWLLWTSQVPDDALAALDNTGSGALQQQNQHEGFYQRIKRNLKWRLEAPRTTHNIQRSTSKKTNALFCGNAFTIPANRDVITLKGNLMSEALLLAAAAKKEKSAQRNFVRPSSPSATSSSDNAGSNAAGAFAAYSAPSSPSPSLLNQQQQQHQLRQQQTAKSGMCRVSRTDKEQVQRCRLDDIEEAATRRLERRETLAAIGNGCGRDRIVTGSLTSSSLQRQDADDDDVYGQKSHLRCISGRGAFIRSSKSNWALLQKCIVFNLADELALQAGHAVLEWGTGCGHTLTMLKQLFDVDGVGIGVEAPLASATRWARKHALGHFCQAPPLTTTTAATQTGVAGNNSEKQKSQVTQSFSSLLLLPVEEKVDDEADKPLKRKTQSRPLLLHFDAVISIAALARVRTVFGRCSVLREAIRVLRPGGRAFFGGFGGVDDMAAATTSWISWMSQCRITAADFDKQVAASIKMRHHDRESNSGSSHSEKSSLFDSVLKVESFVPIRELGLYPGTDHQLWKDVLLLTSEQQHLQQNRFEGSSYAVVIRK